MENFAYEVKTTLDAIKNSVDEALEKARSAENRMNEIEVREQSKGLYFSSGGTDPIQKALAESEDIARLLSVGGRRRASVVLPIGIDLKSLVTKATITSGTVGSATSGVLVPDRVGAIVPGAERRVHMRDVLRSATTSGSAIDYVRENSFTNMASPQVEASAKGESSLTFDTETAPVRTIAHWIPASKQILDDMPSLQNYISRKLIYGLLTKEDEQLLIGDGTGVNIEGLVPQATPFNMGLLNGPDGWEKADLIRRALQQIEEADEVSSDFVVLNPRDWADIELAKDTDGNYLVGNPRAMLTPMLWGKPVVVTTAIGVGKFLVGSSEAAELRIRQEITIDISTEHADFFSRNLVAIRAEERIAMPVYRPNALIYGSMTTSPV